MNNKPRRKKLNWKQKHIDRNKRIFGKKWFYLLCDEQRYQERPYRESEVSISFRSQKFV
jgi:hypothetical protein